MAEMRDQYGNPVIPTAFDQYGNPIMPAAVDQYGNPLYQTDQYGNPIGQPQMYTSQQQPYAGMGTGTTTETYGTGVADIGGQGQMMPGKLRTGEGMHNQQGLQRTGSSSSSSSSEDDGQGGRRKKSLKQKIKEKIPGMGGNKSATTATSERETFPQGHREGLAAATGMTGPTGMFGHEEHGHAQVKEKKGVMEKIKEKLPGGHHH